MASLNLQFIKLLEAVNTFGGGILVSLDPHSVSMSAYI